MRTIKLSRKDSVSRPKPLILTRGAQKNRWLPSTKRMRCSRIRNSALGLTTATTRMSRIALVVTPSNKVSTVVGSLVVGSLVADSLEGSPAGASLVGAISSLVNGVRCILPHLCMFLVENRIDLHLHMYFALVLVETEVPTHGYT